MLAFGVAMLIATPWGGVAADRFPKRSVLLVAVSLLVVSSLIVGLAVVTDVIEYWMLLVASAIQATAFALYLPTRIAFIAEVVEPEDIGAGGHAQPDHAGGDAGDRARPGGRADRPVVVRRRRGVPPGGRRPASWPAPCCSACRRARRGRHRRGHRSPRWSMPSGTSAPAADSASSHSPRSASWSSASRTSRSCRRWPTNASASAPAATGVMSGVAGLGAVVAGVVAPRRRWVMQRPWATVAVSGGALGVSLIALGLAGAFWLALVALLGVGAAGPRVPDDDAVVDAVAVGRRLPRTDAEHGRARLQRVRARRPPARVARRRHHVGASRWWPWASSC